MRYEIVGNVVRIEAEALPSVDDWIRGVERIVADPRFRPGFHFYVDRRGATGSPTAGDLRRVTAWISERSHFFVGSRWASVIDDDAGYGMARMAEVFSEDAPLDYRPFRSPTDALAWLESPAPSSEP